MRFWLSKLLVIISVFSISVFAQSRKMGIGLQIGEPTGLNARYRFAENQAINFGIGYSLIDDGFSTNGNYLIMFTKLGLNPVIPYIGPGLIIQSGKKKNVASGLFLGPEIKAGGEFFISNSPMSIYLDLTLNAFIIPSGRMSAGIAVGFHYWI